MESRDVKVKAVLLVAAATVGINVLKQKFVASNDLTTAQMAADMVDAGSVSSTAYATYVPVPSDGITPKRGVVYYYSINTEKKDKV